MNNYKGEAFPENIKRLTENSYEFSEAIKVRLNKPKDSLLHEFY